MKKILWVLFGGYTSLFSFLAVQKSRIFQNSLDFPTYLQALWTTLNGEPFVVTWDHAMVPNESLLGLHLELTLLLLAPVYALWQSPEPFLILQAIIVGLAVFPVYACAVHVLGKQYLGLCFALAYFANPFLQRALLSDFHPESMQFAALVSAGCFLIMKRYRWFAFWAVFAAMTREDSCLHLFVLGFYAFVFQKERRTGTATMALSLGGFLLASFVVIPYFGGEPHGIFAERYAALGDSLPDVVWNFFSSPEIFLETAFDPVNLNTFFWIMLPFAFLPLCSLRGLLLIAPAVAMMWLTHWRYLKLQYFFYPLTTHMFFPVASILGLWSLSRLFPSPRQELWRLAGGAAACALSVVLMILPLSHADVHQDQQAAYYRNRFPLAWGFSWKHYVQNEHERRGHAFIRRELKSNAQPLSATWRHAAHLADRRVLRSFPMPEEETEGVFLDFFGPPAYGVASADKYRVWDFLRRTDYGVTAFEDGFTLLRKGAPDERNREILSLLQRRLEAEKLHGNTGKNMHDAEPPSRRARYARAGKHKPGYLVFGPYIPLERGTYYAAFVLKTGKVNQRLLKEEAAILEVHDADRDHVIARRPLTVRDFRGMRFYQSFYLYFRLEAPAKRLEFRVLFHSVADLWVDRIEYHTMSPMWAWPLNAFWGKDLSIAK